MIQTPPPGALVYASADYDGLELRSMAQACLLLVGESRLAQVLNAGEDPHLHMAASMLGITYEQAKAGKASGDEQEAKRIDDARQAGKVANFGFPGGLGAEKLVLFARKSYRVLLTVESAKALKRRWLSTFPEFRKYFDAIAKMVGPDGATFRHFFTGRVRGGAPYTAACNSFFQGLGADATGHALFLIQEACYTPKPCRACTGAGCPSCFGTGVSPLYGTRMVNYIHDEFLIETPEERGHEVAHELVRVMVEGAAPFLPDVPATAEPKLMRYWSKDAKQVWTPDKTDPNRRLVAWPKA